MLRLPFPVVESPAEVAMVKMLVAGFVMSPVICLGWLPGDKIMRIILAREILIGEIESKN